MIKGCGFVEKRGNSRRIMRLDGGRMPAQAWITANPGLRF
jgi:hypothetical protein